MRRLTLPMLLTTTILMSAPAFAASTETVLQYLKDHILAVTTENLNKAALELGRQQDGEGSCSNGDETSGSDGSNANGGCAPQQAAPSEKSETTDANANDDPANDSDDAGDTSNEMETDDGGGGGGGGSSASIIEFGPLHQQAMFVLNG